MTIRPAGAIYSAVIELVIWVILVPIEWGRIARGRSSRARLRERLGRSPALPAGGQRVVVHAVSAGEMRAASALLDAIARERPDVRFLLTTGTRDGLAIADRLRPRAPIDAIQYLPWDSARTIRRWLAAVDPSAVAIVETEIWPNLFRACRERGVPLVIVSGRIGEPHARRYALLRSWFTHVLDAASWIGAQSAHDRDAFVRMGAAADRVVVTGNLKDDAAPAPDARPSPWAAAIDAARPLIIAGSTHEPEEKQILQSLLALRQAVPGVRLVIAPRHVRRARRVASLAADLGLRVARWSQPTSEPWDVLVLDEMGWLSHLYRAGAVAVVGGTLSRHGGHSISEAAAAGCAIVIGGSTTHIRAAVERLVQAHAILRLPQGEPVGPALTRSLVALVADPHRRLTMGARALRALTRGRGAAPISARVVLRLLHERAEYPSEEERSCQMLIA